MQHMQAAMRASFVMLLVASCSRVVERAPSETVEGPTENVSFEFMGFETNAEQGRVARFRATSRTDRTILGIELFVETFDSAGNRLGESFTVVTSLRRWLEPRAQREENLGSNLSERADSASVRVDSVTYVRETAS